MTLKARISFGLLAAAGLMLGLALGFSPAQAQPACAADDIACRLSAIERRLDALEGRQGALEGRQEQVSAQAEAIQRAQGVDISISRPCRTNCEAEAQAICVERGYASGIPDDWSRERGAGVRMTSVTCRN